MKRAIVVLWPSFLVACVGELVIFSLFDPMELHLLGEPLDVSRTAVYSVGFFGLWLLTAISSALTLGVFVNEPAAET